MRDFASPLDGFLSPFGAVRGRVFSPLSLFASGEAGAWYDPSDLSTLYQDSVGTTPVTAAGQPVGLVLDKSQGLTLGAELVTNGTFDTDTTGWSKSGDLLLSVVSNALRVTRQANVNQYAYQEVTVEAGKFYRCTFDYLGGGGGTEYLDLRVGSTVGGSDYFRDVSIIDAEIGQYGFTFLATTTSAFLNFYLRNGISGSFLGLDNISVRELPGNHLTQATAAARPVYQTSPDRLDHDGVDDVMNVTLPDLGTNATVASVAGGTVTYLEAQTISGSYAAPTSDWAGLVIIDRALTADEKASLEGIWT